MNPEILQFEPAHAVKLQAYVDANVMTVSETANIYRGLGPSFTLKMGGEIIACGGVAVNPLGHGQVWSILSPKIKDFKKTTFAFLKSSLEESQKRTGVRRMECLVKAGFAEGERLMEHLGFHNETPRGMKQYGPDGSTYNLFARIF